MNYGYDAFNYGYDTFNYGYDAFNNGYDAFNYATDTFNNGYDAFNYVTDTFNYGYDTYREFDNSYDIIGDIGRYSDDQLGIQYEFATQMRLPDVSTGAGEVGSTVTRQTGTYKELLDAGANDSHHIIQDAAMRDIPGYNRMKAPAVQLDGPAREIGTPHYNATQAQRSTIGGGTYGAERRIGYRSLREAGLSVDEAKATIRGADRYFMDELGLGLDSPTRMPGNRTRGR